MPLLPITLPKSKSLTETLKVSLFDELEDGYKIQLQFPYEEEKNILYVLGNSEVLEKQYLETITYTCLVNQDIFDKLSAYSPTLIQNSIIKKVQ